MRIGGRMEKYISKQESIMLKGFAIICMVMHHFFTFPEWYENVIDYGELTEYFAYMREPFRVCVPIFAILTGFAYGGGNEISFRKAGLKVLNFLKGYWFVYFLLVLLSIVVCKSPVDWYYLITGLFGITANYACFCWYVYFFVFAMLLMPIVIRLCKKSIIWWFAIYFISILGGFFMTKVMLPNDIWTPLYNCCYYYNYILIGVAIGEYHLFERLSKIVIFSGRDWYSIIVLALIAVVAFMAPAVLGINVSHINLVGLYAVVLIYCLVTINQSKKESRVLLFLGKHATNIWYLHCVFFAGATMSIFKPILYLFKQPILVFLWGISWCVLGSLMINKINKLVTALTKGKWLNNNSYSKQDLVEESKK